MSQFQSLFKTKYRLVVKAWLRDSSKTLLTLPFHIILGVYAAFLQCITQLYYDFTNNCYKIKD